MAYTANLIPDMTSNTEPSGTVTFSDGELGVDYMGYKAFDRDAGTMYHSQGNAFPKSLTYAFPASHIVTKYTLANSPITAWKFQGSNNGTDFTDLDTQTGQTIGETPVAYEIANTTAYTTYRILASAGTYSNYFTIVAVEMMENLPADGYLVHMSI